jgi:hypothetical protein
MSIDRDEVYRRQCLCGRGEVVITFCSPDHPWTTRSISFETEILCENCGLKYELIEQNDKYYFVEKNEVENRNALRAEYQQRCDNLLKLPQTIAALKEFGEFLESQPSVAVRHRLLKKADFINETYNTFRRHWVNANDWIRYHVRANHIVAILNILAKNEPNISAEVHALEKLYAGYRVPLITVGKPLLDTFSYRNR